MAWLNNSVPNKVRMPWDHQFSKWDRLKNCPLPSESKDLVKSIQCGEKRNLFKVLSHWPEDKRFNLLLQIRTCALRLDSYFSNNPISLLRTGRSGYVSLTDAEVACLLANAFYCTFDQQGANFRHFSFERLFGENESPIKTTKIESILRYFETYFAEEHERESRAWKQTKNSASSSAGDHREIKIERRFLDYNMDWRQANECLCNLIIEPEQRIEDVHLPDYDVWHADFADRFIGGGSFNLGSLQEEIRFWISPELLVTVLICEVMDDRDAIVVHGVRRFSDYSGYASTFRTQDLDSVSSTPKVINDAVKFFSRKSSAAVKDPVRMMPQTVFAVDAIDLRHQHGAQFDEHSIRRDLDKFFCGVSHVTEEKGQLMCVSASFMQTNGAQSHRPTAVVTGNWGCGAFHGDRLVKVMVQILAASYAGRDLIYCTMNDSEFTKELQEMKKIFKTANLTIADYYNMLAAYAEGPGNRRFSFLQFLRKQISDRLQ